MSRLSVDGLFCAIRDRALLDGGHDASRPRMALERRYPGPRRPKGHDRLMDTVGAPVDDLPVSCPTCGERAGSTFERTAGGISTANHLCVLGHMWEVRWLADAGAA